MKHSFKASKQALKKQNNQTAVPTMEKRQSRSLPRWLILALCLLVPAAGVWAALEFVVWNKVPPELVGKWIVMEGPDEGGTIDFYRHGTMVAKVNNGGFEGIINATIQVDNKKIYVTTTHQTTGAKGTRVQNIKTLTEDTLILEDEKGVSIRLQRAM